ncbi:hypothetical protein FCL40_04910 [Ferrimonas sediminicola]|uniref:Lipoprotein n=1 Tax=Ferrimonas sediminicola TaxID=2569538 RepID=A0A4U1BHG4_9GAMM|nr:hypothetical protein [Ferrimonas sediminicola]TKB50494.1 hypothetical protein FCL40_04910 [Ferrimonas sediminicola]
MKRTLIALVLANLALVGCGSDDNNDTKPIDKPPVEPPVETVVIAEAETMAVADLAFNAESGVVTFALATEDGKAITGLQDAANITAFNLAYVGMPEPKQRSHMTEGEGPGAIKVTLPVHQQQQFPCSADDCQVQIAESESTPGSYTVTPVNFKWESVPVTVKAALTFATEKVTVSPVWTEVGQ